MIVSTLVAAACTLAAGSAVPWQGRQVAVVMAGGMAALVIPGLDPPGVVIAGVWVLSAMIGTAGLAGRPEAESCRHRALGGIAMTLCLMGGAVSVPGAGVPAQEGHQHGIGFALPLLGAVAVLTMVVWTVAGPHRSASHARTRTLLRWEAWAMTVGLIAMWLGHAI